MQKKIRNRWTVVMASVVVQFFLGALYTWSVFQKPIEQTFGWSTSQVSLAFSINLAIIPFFLIIAGRQLQRFGPTKMVITGATFLSIGLLIASQTSSLPMLYLGYGVFGGIGIGTAYGIPIATCMKWFPDKRGLIAGLSTAGFGLGAMFYSQLATFLVSQNGPLDTFFFQAFYTIIGVTVGGMFMRAAPDDYVPEGWIPAQNNGVSKYNFMPKEMLRTPQYYFILIMYVFANISGLMIIAHASPIGQEVASLSVLQAGRIVSLLSIGDMSGRILWGLLSDKIGRSRVIFLMYVLSAITMLTINSLDSFWLYGIGIMLIAFCFGGAMSNFPALTADYFGVKYVSWNYGFVFLAYSVGALIGPRLAALVAESSGGSYKLAFIITGSLCIVGAIMALLSKKPKAPSKSEISVAEEA